MHQTLVYLGRAINALHLVERALKAHDVVAETSETDGMLFEHSAGDASLLLSWTLRMPIGEVTFEFENGDEWPCVFYCAESDTWETRLSPESAERNPEYTKFARWHGVKQTETPISERHAITLISFLTRCFVVHKQRKKELPPDLEDE
ncbi:MAG: hypothetical protein ABII13_02800 [Patescibacteria group bacterium]|nr:hypothetical protein [Patescibacteria group bacterium]